MAPKTNNSRLTIQEQNIESVFEDIKDIKKSLQDFLNRFEDVRDKVIEHGVEINNIKSCTAKQENINKELRDKDTNLEVSINDIKRNVAKYAGAISVVVFLASIVAQVLIKLFVK